MFFTLWISTVNSDKVLFTVVIQNPLLCAMYTLFCVCKVHSLLCFIIVVFVISLQVNTLLYKVTSFSDESCLLLLTYAPQLRMSAVG
jgi:hypothetical protein